MTTKDDWFFQQDIERQFVEFPDWGGDLVTVFEERRSYVEALQYFCFPTPASRLSETTFNEPSWHYDFTSSRAKLLQRSPRHFLGRALRNRAGSIELRWMGPRRFYIDPSERIVARQETRNDYAYSYKRILINPSLIARFLAETRQTLLWCVSSIRFSERRLEEFQATSYSEQVRCRDGIYVRSANPITPEGKNHLPRMESASRVVGKRRVHEIDRYLCTDTSNVTAPRTTAS